MTNIRFKLKLSVFGVRVPDESLLLFTILVSSAKTTLFLRNNVPLRTYTLSSPPMGQYLIGIM